MKAQIYMTFTVFLKMVTASTDFHTLQHNQQVTDNYENEGKGEKKSTGVLQISEVEDNKKHG